MSELPPSLRANPELDRWIRIGADGTVRVGTGKVELGQGILTALARIAAEELDVAPERVQVAAADTDESPNELFTAGSQSIESSGAAVRLAAAEARRILVEQASARLGVAVEELVVEDGVVGDATRAHSVSYWELMGGRRFDGPVTGRALPKPPAAYRLVGRAARRLDLPGKISGAASFVHDLELPGLVHGRVVRPPAPGARLLALDAEAVRGWPGVLGVVRDGSFLGVVAAREEQAVAAAEALRSAARWSEPPLGPRAEEMPEFLLERQAESLRVEDGIPVDGPIPPVETPEAAVATLDEYYTRPHQMHASLGPSAALASLADGRLTVWTHSQGIHLLRGSLARVLGMPPERVRVVHAEGAGCYGHNGADDAALDAALLARALPGHPVRLQWMRQDEHAWEPYGPAMVIRIRASLDAQGRLLDWNHDVWSNTHVGRPLPQADASGLLAAWHLEEPLPPPPARPFRAYHGGIHRNADPLYAIPRRRIVKHLVADAPLRTSATRSLGAYANVFAIESAMDELARAAGADPVAFRLRHLEDARARAVIEAAAARAGWEPGGGGQGRGRGIGFARYKNEKCYAAVIVELEADASSGEIRLGRAVVAADAGRVVDPDGLANQLEGGLIQSASWTLKEAVGFDGQRVTSVDWESYPILTFLEVPEVETVLLDRPDLSSLGSGEAAQGPTAAAIANAVFHATGRRLRDLPLTPERLRGARG